ncbi:hypothetical protein INT46_007655, partial [Mucor plumbeus]
MRSSLLSALIIASTVSTALGAPAASNSISGSFASPSIAKAQAEASIDPRIEKWARMKGALPDGIFPEDKRILKEQRRIVPMIVIKEENLPKPTAVTKKSVDKHQRINIEPAYKHMGITRKNNEANFLNAIKIAPFSPEMQKDLNQKHKASSSNVEQYAPVTASKRYRKYLGVSDNGESKIMDLPVPPNVQDIKASEREESHASLQEKNVVGLDNHGRMRFVDVPFYNRGSSTSQ